MTADQGDRITTARKRLRSFLGGENNDSDISEDEEAELEHHLQVFSEESR